MKNINLRTVFTETDVKELKEMKEIDNEVTKIFNSSVDKIKYFDVAWLIKDGDYTIGYTDLIVEKDSLNYYLDLGLKAGYRTKEVMVEVLNKVKEQALSTSINLEAGINRHAVELALNNFDINTLEDTDKSSMVYKLKIR